MSITSRAIPDEVSARQATRSLLSDFLAERSSVPRIARCGLVPTGAAVTVKRTEGGGHFAGLARCGSSAACPACTPKIREGRAGEIAQAAVRWLEMGGRLLFVTLTMPHDRANGEERYGLRQMFDVQTAALRAVHGGSGGQALAQDYGVPCIRSSKKRGMYESFALHRIVDREATYSDRAGWHPHVHALWFVRGTFDEKDKVSLQTRLDRAWGDFIVGAGYRRPKAGGVGVRLDMVKLADHRPETVGAALGKYLVKAEEIGNGRANKWGVHHELARHDRKRAKNGKGASPWQLLEGAAFDGDADSWRLWLEWEQATHGRQLLTWSPGLHELVAVEKKEDDELNDAEAGGEAVAVIPREVWSKVIAVRGCRGAILVGAVDGLLGVRLAMRANGLGHLAGQITEPELRHGPLIYAGA